MKKLLYIALLLIFQIHDVYANEYNTVEDILNDESFTIDKLGYSSRSSDCQTIIDGWIEKLSNYIDNNPTDARALFYRGRFYGFKPSCWRRVDPVIKLLDRKAYLESQFLKDNIEKINTDWMASLIVNENSTDEEKQLTWFMLNGMFSGYIRPEVVEKKEKLRIKIATPENLGAGTEHPIDKNAFRLKQYEKIADKYNDVDDRENVTRILNELAQISLEGAAKVGELLPLYEKAWEERDNKIALQKEESTIEANQEAKPAQSQPQTLTARVEASQATKKPTERSIATTPSAESDITRTILIWALLAIGLVVILYFIRRPRKP